MLVLSRKTLESVVVLTANGVEPIVHVTVLEIDGRRVRLGFAANEKVAIHRQEIWEQLRNGALPASPKRGPPAPARS